MLMWEFEITLPARRAADKRRDAVCVPLRTSPTKCKPGPACAIRQKRRVSNVSLALAVVSVMPADAQRLKAGVLTCDVSAGMGFIIGSQRAGAGRSAADL